MISLQKLGKIRGAAVRLVQVQNYEHHHRLLVLILHCICLFATICCTFWVLLFEKHVLPVIEIILVTADCIFFILFVCALWQIYLSKKIDNEDGATGLIAGITRKKLTCKEIRALVEGG